MSELENGQLLKSKSVYDLTVDTSYDVERTNGEPSVLYCIENTATGVREYEDYNFYVAHQHLELMAKGWDEIMKSSMISTPSLVIPSTIQ